MIKEFLSNGKILFFPKTWANSVSRWILGVNSPSGTITIKNTANPESLSATFDVDLKKTSDSMYPLLKGKFIEQDDVFGIVEKSIDNASLVSTNGQLKVSDDWINNLIKTTTTSSYTDNTNASNEGDDPEASELSFSDWQSGGENGVKLRLYALIDSDMYSGSHVFQPIDIVIGSDGKMESVKVPSGNHGVLIGA